MRVLLDTHVVLWFLDGDARLSTRARALIEDVGNERLLSVASLWEIALKVRLGKLSSVAGSLPTETIMGDLEANRITVLAIIPAHALRVATLPRGHGDPFDLLIAAQAITERIPVVGGDMQFDALGVTRVW